MCKSVSVIVPIYNVEQYLEECIKSIMAQTLSDIEIILVDDGSTDGCPAICDAFAAADSRIQVIHKENGGLVSARKAGLLQATGKYVGYVDGDDFIEPDMYERMYGLAEEADADMAAVGYQVYDGKENRKVENQLAEGIYAGNRLKSIYKDCLCTESYYHWRLMPSVWSKLFRRTLLLKVQMAVPDEVSMGEDVACTYPALFNSRRIIINHSFFPYHYRVVADSMSRELNDNYFESIASLVRYLREFAKVHAAFGRQAEFYRCYIVNVGIVRIWDKHSTLTYSQKCEKTRQTVAAYPELFLGDDRQLPMVIKAEFAFLRNGIFPLLPFCIRTVKSL